MIAPASQFMPQRLLITSEDRLGLPNVFPMLPGQGFLQAKSPEFSTTVQLSSSFRESAVAWAQYPRWHYQVAYEVIRDRPNQQELAQLYEFFCNQAGMADSWWYYDPFDHSAVAEPFGTGDGTTRTFQLLRSVRTYSEPVYGVSGTPQVFDNGSPAGAFTVSEYGAVTFSSPPAAGHALTWTGTWTRLCRFEQDQIDPAQLMLGLWDITKGIKFVSRKPY